MSYSQTQFTLSQCIDYALVHNPSIKTALVDEEIADKNKWVIASAGFPKLNAYGSFDDNVKIPVTPVPAAIFDQNAPPDVVVPLRFGSRYATTGYLQVDQLIYNGSYLVALKASKASKIYYGEALKQTVENTIYEVSSAYFQALTAKKEMEIQKENVERTRKLLDIVDLQYKNELIIKADRDRVLVSYNNEVSRLRRAQRDWQQAINNLQFRMGMSITETIELKEINENLDSIIVNLGDAIVVNYDARADYRVLKAREQLQELQVKQYRSEYQPVVTAFGRYQYQKFRQELEEVFEGDNWFNSQIIGLRLNVPIFNGLENRFEVQKARLDLLKAHIDVKRQEQLIGLELANAFKAYQTAVENVKVARDNIALAEEVYNVQLLLFEEGVGSYADLLDATNSLEVSQLNYTTSMLAVYLARVELARANGKLNEVVEWNY
ncbi:MAG TPA: TolC family protein [Cytophagaceae bacterium]